MICFCFFAVVSLSFDKQYYSVVGCQWGTEQWLETRNNYRNRYRNYKGWSGVEGWSCKAQFYCQHFSWCTEVLSVSRRVTYQCPRLFYIKTWDIVLRRNGTLLGSYMSVERWTDWKMGTNSSNMISHANITSQIRIIYSPIIESTLSLAGLG